MLQDEDGGYNAHDGELDASFNDGELSTSYDTDGFDYDYDYDYSGYDDQDYESDSMPHPGNADEPMIVVALAAYKPTDDSELVRCHVQSLFFFCFQDR